MQASRRLAGPNHCVIRAICSVTGSSLSSPNQRVSVNIQQQRLAAAAAPTSSQQYCQRRWMGSGGGARGARGHGWWVNYRQGKGGRHLQGEYFDRSLEELQAWNDAVFSLGSRMAYMDIKTEAAVVMVDTASAAVEGDSKNSDDNVATHRLKLELATAVLPLATENFLKLLQSPAGVGYTSTTLHRVEKKVGLMGGLVWNERQSDGNERSYKQPMLVGKCHEDLRMPTSWTNMDVSSERLVLSHVPGILTMVCPRVHEIDSRFMFCSTYSPHLDGKAVAIGRLADEESMQTVQKWEQTLITHKGRPTNVVLRIVECGLLQGGASQPIDSTAVVNEQSEGKQLFDKI